MKRTTLTLRRAAFLCLLLSCLHVARAEKSHVRGIFTLTHAQSYSEIPFQLINDLIVIPVLVNGEQTLNFILDTGTQSPIILNDKYVKGMDMKLGRNMRFQGAGNGKLVEGRVISSMSLQIGDAYAGHIGGLLLDNNPLSNLRLEKLRIHGIIGASLFRSFAVEIDYITQTLRLHDDRQFLNQHAYSAHEMEIEVSRPLLRTEVVFREKRYPLKLMIDTGFNNQMLIYDSEAVDFHPRRFSMIGKGYSGNIKGSEVNLKSLKLANRQLFNLSSFFPSRSSYKKWAEANHSGRDGIIGNKLLKQFCVVLDYANEKFYLQEHLFSQPELAQEAQAEASSDKQP